MTTVTIPGTKKLNLDNILDEAGIDPNDSSSPVSISMRMGEVEVTFEDLESIDLNVVDEIYELQI